MSTNAGPTVEDEWKAAARAGARKRRRLMIPAIVGGTLFVVTTFGAFLAVGSYLGERAEAREKELADRGLVEVHYSRGRTLTKAERQRDAGAGLFVLAVVLGLGAGAAGFFATGGKLSAEHARGFMPD